MIHVVLVSPQKPGNVGAVARVMKNFGFSKLHLVNPCEINEEAKNRAKHANDILEKANHLTQLPKLDTLIATTGKKGNDFNMPRSFLTPSQLELPSKSNIGLVFGREDKGLTNQEIKKCDFVVKIPTKSTYPILNLSHAVSILLYEISKSKNTSQPTPVSLKEKEQLLKLIDQTLDNMDFTTQNKKETQKIVWKRIIGKSFLTKREAYTLMGYFKKLL